MAATVDRLIRLTSAPLIRIVLIVVDVSWPRGTAWRCREGTTSRYYYRRRRRSSVRRTAWTVPDAGDNTETALCCSVLVRRRVKFPNAENTPRSVLAVSDGYRAPFPYSCSRSTVRGSPHLVCTSFEIRSSVRSFVRLLFFFFFSSIAKGKELAAHAATLKNRFNPVIEWGRENSTHPRRRRAFRLPWITPPVLFC